MTGFPVFALGFVGEVESLVVAGARKASGLGVAEAVGVGVAALVSVLDVLDDVEGFPDCD